ncbi:hypothetical protein AM1_4083 [Acaryochloris marina MBIC11017]|uniref:Uncharacterized protein n=1 Tax=Acaryochloris marina (strain MBIC 11017) TaxID=329726 RepID=B0CAJ8_ACAM1|nr:hypothetical protein AM1_4083 [Acaryochloris marina MBIC11017]
METYQAFCIVRAIATDKTTPQKDIASRSIHWEKFWLQCIWL